MRTFINVFYKFNVYMAQRILCAAVYPGFLPCFVKGHLLQGRMPRPVQSLGAQRFGVMRRLRRGVAQS